MTAISNFFKIRYDSKEKGLYSLACNLTKNVALILSLSKINLRRSAFFNYKSISTLLTIVSLGKLLFDFNSTY